MNIITLNKKHKNIICVFPVVGHNRLKHIENQGFYLLCRDCWPNMEDSGKDDIALEGIYAIRGDFAMVLPPVVQHYV